MSNIIKEWNRKRSRNGTEKVEELRDEDKLDFTKMAETAKLYSLKEYSKSKNKFILSLMYLTDAEKDVLTSIISCENENIFKLSALEGGAAVSKNTVYGDIKKIMLNSKIDIHERYDMLADRKFLKLKPFIVLQGDTGELPFIKK